MENENLILEASVNVEKLKVALCNYINDILTASGSNSCTISVGRLNIDNVVAAKPYNKVSVAGVQPYVDIELILANGNSVLIGIRQRAENPFSKKLGRFAIPALEKGMAGLEKVYPNIRRDFVSSLLVHYTSHGYVHGSVVSQAYGIISDKTQKERILLGSPDLGGKVDFVFSIERPSFWYKGIGIPPASTGYKSGRFTISFKKTIGMSATEIMSRNEIYMWIPTATGRTLYLGDDKRDRANMPAIIGPKVDVGGVVGRGKYGGKIKIGINNVKKNKDVFEIMDNERSFRLELKSKLELEKEKDSKSTTQPFQHPSTTKDDHDDDEIEALFRRAGRRNRDGYKPLNAIIQKKSLDYEERDELIDAIYEKFVKGVKELEKIDIDNKKTKESVKENLEDEDDNTLKRLYHEPAHRLARELKTRGYGIFTDDDD